MHMESLNFPRLGLEDSSGMTEEVCSDSVASDVDMSVLGSLGGDLAARDLSFSFCWALRWLLALKSAFGRDRLVVR